MKKWFFIFMFLVTTLVYADNLRTPPILIDEPVSEQLWHREIYDNWMNLEECDTNPDGYRPGKKGDMILYQQGANYYLEVYAGSGPTWLGVQLTNTP